LICESIILIRPVSDPLCNESEALRLAAFNNHQDCVKLLIPVSDPKVVKELKKVKQIK